jgi:hypothetical protein
MALQSFRAFADADKSNFLQFEFKFGKCQNLLMNFCRHYHKNYKHTIQLKKSDTYVENNIEKRRNMKKI